MVASAGTNAAQTIVDRPRHEQSPSRSRQRAACRRRQLRQVRRVDAVVNKSWKPDGDLETRYKRARQEWDQRMGGAVVQAHNWRLATLCSLGLVFASLLGTVYLGAQPKAVPHIVQVDRLGAPTYLGPVGQAARDYKPSDASMKYHLRRFIVATRSVSSDAAVMRQSWLDAYALITQSAANQLNAYAEKSDPFKRGAELRVSIDAATIVQLSPDTWEADWVEKTWDKAGNETDSSIWRGTFRVVVRTPDSEEQLSQNPIGLFIDEFHWSKVQG
jgi:type IV secretion system protein VirB5